MNEMGLRHLAFEVKNIQETVDKLENRGITCEKVRIDKSSNKKFTFFKDPDELPIEIYEA
jgi:glyoxylase I family protein